MASSAFEKMSSVLLESWADMVSDEEAEAETVAADQRKLLARKKQILYGKNTDGFRRVCELFPLKANRPPALRPPDKFQTCSKRSWDGQVSKWRRILHIYDPNLADPLQTAGLAAKCLSCSKLVE